jgi:SAM-dependent methyltransferase
MQDSSKKVVLDLLSASRPATILDAPSGDGWLRKRLPYEAAVDGIDLFETRVDGYRSIFNFDLDDGLPAELPVYEAVACCEGLEHLGNPLLFLKTAKAHLADTGLLVITTPNIWYPAARLQFLIRGYFPSFPSLAGKIVRGSHMHIMPWSFPQLYLHLKLAGYTDIRMHEEPLSKAKHAWEKMVAWPQIAYCRRRAKKAPSAEERAYWQAAGSGPSVFGRHLIVTARPVDAS